MPGIDLRTTTSLHPHARSTVQSIQNTTSTLAPAPTLNNPSIHIHRIVWQSYTHKYSLQNPNRARRSAPLQVGRVNGCNSAFSRQAATRFGTILPSRTNGFNAAHAEGGILLTRATTRKLQECRGEAALPASASLSPHESTKNLSSQCWASGRKHQKNGA